LETGRLRKAAAVKRSEKQVEAFAAVRADIGSFYTVNYKPRGNEGSGFRKIEVEVVKDHGRTLRVRSRSGYRPR
jgi:hypothetical protein